MVTSTDSGLAVPDWPLSYGTLFPPMIGGVFFEHGHRMVASAVGLLTLIFAFALNHYENRIWLKAIGFIALTAVILQGLLGGLTVLMMLPTPISVSHATLAQTFFLITIFIAYSLSKERSQRTIEMERHNSLFLQLCIIFIIFVYSQLIFGAIMRHTGSGLAIYDFPQMAGYWFPPFNDEMLSKINLWRFDNDYDPITMSNVVYHSIHRLGALVITFALCALNYVCFRSIHNFKIKKTILMLDGIIILQILLGVTSVLTQKPPIVTSFHVVTGASVLGVSFLLILRAAPTSYINFKKLLFSNGQ